MLRYWRILMRIFNWYMRWSLRAILVISPLLGFTLCLVKNSSCSYRRKKHSIRRVMLLVLKRGIEITNSFKKKLIIEDFIMLSGNRRLKGMRLFVMIDLSNRRLGISSRKCIRMRTPPILSIKWRLSRFVLVFSMIKTVMTLAGL